MQWTAFAFLVLINLRIVGIVNAGSSLWSLFTIARLFFHIFSIFSCSSGDKNRVIELKISMDELRRQLGMTRNEMVRDSVTK